MNIQKKDLEKSQVELAVELNVDDILPYLKHTATHLSQHKNIPGFRPGKAPYEVIRKNMGDELIFKEALDEIVNGTLQAAILQEKVRAFGDPELNFTKTEPNQIIYTAKFNILPEVKINDWQKEKIKAAEVTVTKEEVDAAVKQLTQMLIKEAAVDRPAQNGDKVFVDFDVLVNGVPIEGGSSKNFGVIIGEGKMIPGFEEQLIGTKAGETKDFKLNFPTEYKPELAGKEAEFKITVNSVLERIEPTIDDELAKKLGVESKKELYSKMEENIKLEKKEREDQRIQIEAVKKVVDLSDIGEIPEQLVESETEKIIHEFEHDLSHQGMQIDHYLKGIGKALEDVKKEFRPKALDRIKTSLVLDELIEQEKLSVDIKDVEKEIELQKQHYKDQPQALEDIGRAGYKNYLYNRMLNKKAIDFIASKIIEQ